MRRIQVIKNRACGAHHVIIILVKNRPYNVKLFNLHSSPQLLYMHCYKSFLIPSNFHFTHQTRTRSSLYRQNSISNMHARRTRSSLYCQKILTPDVQDHPYTVKIPFHMNARRTRSSLYRQNSFSHKLTHARLTTDSQDHPYTVKIQFHLRIGGDSYV